MPISTTNQFAFPTLLLGRLLNIVRRLALGKSRLGEVYG
jgi:hypothetical protein